MHLLAVTFVVAALPGLTAVAAAQTPVAPPPPSPPPPKIWTVTASAGLALSTGNTDTSSINIGYSIVYDPQTKNVVKSDGLFLRSKDTGVLSGESLALSGRDEYKISARTYLYGQLQYLRDEFNAIEYLVAPTGGVGYKLITLPQTELSVDGGAGVVWEKDTGEDLETSGALSLGDKFTQKISSTATFKQTFSALWKTKDFGDVLYINGLSLTAAVSTHTQLKIEWLDTYRSKPAGLDIKPNDMKFLFALVFKN